MSTKRTECPLQRSHRKRAEVEQFKRDIIVQVKDKIKSGAVCYEWTALPTDCRVAPPNYPKPGSKCVAIAVKELIRPGADRFTTVALPSGGYAPCHYHADSPYVVGYSVDSEDFILVSRATTSAV